LGVSEPYTWYLAHNVVATVAWAGVAVACALALHRRRWRFGYLPVLVFPIGGLVARAYRLPSTVQELSQHPGPIVDDLATAAQVLRPVAFACAGVGLVVAYTLLTSTSVLQRSALGAGSVVARARVLRANSVMSFSRALFAAIGASLDEIEGRPDFDGGDASQEISPHIDSRPQDRGIAVVLDRQLAAAGWSRSDLTFYVVTNARAADELHAERPTQVVPILSSSCQLDPEAPLLRSQYLDFRNLKASVDTYSWLTEESSPERRLFARPPADPRSFRAPSALRWLIAVQLLAVSFFGYFFATHLMVIVRGEPDVRWVHTVAALAAAASFTLWCRLVLRRRASGATVNRLRPVLALPAFVMAVAVLTDPRYPTFYRLVLAAFCAMPGWMMMTDERAEIAAWMPAAGEPAPAHVAVPFPAPWRRRHSPGPRASAGHRGVLVSPFVFVAVAVLADVVGRQPI
jgi:hypothetical protein